MITYCQLPKNPLRSDASFYPANCPAIHVPIVGRWVEMWQL